MTTSAAPDTEATKREKVMRRVRAILEFLDDDHATSDEEKQVKLAQAAELMMRYEISEAMLNDGRPDVTRESVVHEAFPVDGTGGFGVHRCVALSRVAAAMDGKSCWVGRNSNKRLTLFVTAHAGVIDALKVLYASMIPAMEAGAARAGKAAREATPGDRQARYHAYRSYLEGFGTGLARRIYQQRHANVVTGAELVLARREREVESAFAQHHPNVSEKRDHRLDRNAYRRGVDEGTAFGSPRVGNTKLELR